MRPRQVLPFIAALLLLAWTVGSLARSGTAGTSILSNSYWLVYLVYLLPVLALVSFIALVVYLAWNWRLISDALGMGIAQKRRMKKKTRNRVQVMIWATFWTIALGAILWRCGTIPCQATNSTRSLPQTVNSIVANSNSPIPTIPGLSGAGVALGNFIGQEWFVWTFLGLLVVSSVILVRGIKVSMDELRADIPLKIIQEKGSVAVTEALGILRAEDAGDPRTRILACYLRMVSAASSLGADVRVDQTARELEEGIRGTFQLKGAGIAELTRLFEEARYSLHPITENDSEDAQEWLLEISEELEKSFGSMN